MTWCSGSAVAAGFPEGDIGHPCVPEFNFHEHRCACDKSGRFDSADISAALTAGGGQSACSISYFGRTWYITLPLFFFFFYRINMESDPTNPQGLWNIWRLKDLVFRLGKKQKKKIWWNHGDQSPEKNVILVTVRPLIKLDLILLSRVILLGDMR